jgi:hypothetical protein
MRLCGGRRRRSRQSAVLLILLLSCAIFVRVPPIASPAATASTISDSGSHTCALTSPEGQSLRKPLDQVRNRELLERNGDGAQ